jgi:peptide/nickel transport system substrate-binding protein
LRRRTNLAPPALPATARLLAFAIALLLGAASLVGCAAARVQRDPNTLVVLERGDGDTLDPLFSSNAYAALYQSFIFDGLVGVGADFTDIPALATSWKSTPDKLHWTVDLRRGVRWSDGAPFTSKDVVFTWNAMLDPKTGFLYRGQFTYVRTVTAAGPYRVHFDLRTKNALFVSQALGSPILPEHVLGKVPHAQLRTTDFGEHPIGTGPYLLQYWRHDQDIAFVANPGWWGGTQSVRRIVIEIVLNGQAGVDAMQEGAADVDDGIVPSSFEALQEGHTKLRLLRVPDLYVDMIQVNTTRPGLSDARVRRAMMYAWDREALTRGYFHGDEQVATSITPIGLRRWYDANVKMYPYDPERARRLLDEAGYLPGPDGIRRRSQIRLAYTVTLTGSTLLDFGAEFQADMRAVGIAITIRTVDFATGVEEEEKGDFDLLPIAWGGVPDPDEKTLLGCDQFPPNGNNVMRFCDPKLSRDVDLGLQTLDYAERRRIYDDMQRRFAEDVPALYSGFRYYEDAISPRVHFDIAKALPDSYFFRDVAFWKLGPL